MTQNPYDAVLHYAHAFNDADVDAMTAECAEGSTAAHSGMRPTLFASATASARDETPSLR